MTYTESKCLIMTLWRLNMTHDDFWWLMVNHDDLWLPMITYHFILWLIYLCRYGDGKITWPINHHIIVEVTYIIRILHIMTHSTITSSLRYANETEKSLHDYHVQASAERPRSWSFLALYPRGTTRNEVVLRRPDHVIVAVKLMV